MSAFRTISEVASELDVPKHVLRFWEAKFSQLRPMKRGGGRRYYRPEDVDLLRGIRWLLYSDGYTIKGVQRILRDNGVRFVKECWRDDGQGSAKTPAALMDIPNLAGEAAEQARKERALSVKPELRGEDRREAAASASGQALPSEYRETLSALLRDLQDCRALLVAAANISDSVPRSAVSTKTRGETRRGLSPQG